MADRLPTPQDYLCGEFRSWDSLRSHDPQLYRLIEDGLRSPEGARWVEAAEALRHCTLGWAPFFWEQFRKDRRALSWIVAAAYHEHWSSSANHAEWLRSKLEEIPNCVPLLEILQKDPDPWVSGMASWAKRVFKGQDRWIGEHRSGFGSPEA